jgi:hypothetical protein
MSFENSSYYYQAGDSVGGFSQTYNFTTQPQKAKPFTIGEYIFLATHSKFVHSAVYGDMGIENCQNTLTQIESEAIAGTFDWIYHIGDIRWAIFRFPS